MPTRAAAVSGARACRAGTAARRSSRKTLSRSTKVIASATSTASVRMISPSR